MAGVFILKQEYCKSWNQEKRTEEDILKTSYCFLPIEGSKCKANYKELEY